MEKNDMRITTLYDPYLDDYVFQRSPEITDASDLEQFGSSNERDIACVFKLVNRHSLKPYIRIDIRETASFNVSLITETYNVKLLHDEEDRLNRIAIVARASNWVTFLHKCRTIANTFLSWIALHAMEAIDILSVEIFDSETKARWTGSLELIHQQMPIRKMEIPAFQGLRKEHRIALGLFREACITSSSFYSLLSLYKILEGIYEKGIFKETHRILKEKGIQERRSKGSITKSMIEHVGTLDNDEFDNFEGKTFREYKEYISELRHKIAHPILDREGESWDAVETDEFTHRIPIAFHARLAKQVVQEALAEELRLLSLIYPKT